MREPPGNSRPCGCAPALTTLSCELRDKRNSRRRSTWWPERRYMWSRGSRLLDEPAGNARVGVDAAVAKERPVAAHFFDAARVALYDESLLGIERGFRQQAAEWIGHEGSPPEFESGVGRPFVAHAVDRGDVEAVGDGVRALDGAPGIELRRTFPRLLGGVPADGRGIEQYLGAGQRRQAGRLGIPLVPTNQRRHAGEARIEAGESQVAGGEVILLVIARIVGDVHLAIDPQQRAIGVHDHGGVVIYA